MSFDADDRERGEQLVLEHREPPFPASAQDAQSAEAGAAAVRARAPAPQERPFDEPPVVDAPPLHDDQQPDGDDAADKPRAGLLKRHPVGAALGMLLALAVAAGSYLYWDNAGHFVSTDDSFIAARQFAIQPKVSGHITTVAVTDNQHVAAGDLIARIDDRDYRIALEQAEAQLAHDRAVLEQAEKNLGRYQYLVDRNAIARQQLDDQTFLVAQDKSTVALDQAKVNAAKLNLSYTTLTAAQAGRVVNLNAAAGQLAQVGTTLTMFVPDQIWVTANFKETQLDAMRPGQPVTLRIDAYPERALHGHIASVQSGSGPAFSLLPPENATGNWVKIVQRVPVKVVLDDARPTLRSAPACRSMPMSGSIRARRSMSG